MIFLLLCKKIGISTADVSALFPKQAKNLGVPEENESDCSEVGVILLPFPSWLGAARLCLLHTSATFTELQQQAPLSSSAS